MSMITGLTWSNWNPTQNSNSPDLVYMILFPPFSIVSCSLDSAYIYPADGGNMFFRNICNNLAEY